MLSTSTTTTVVGLLHLMHISVASADSHFHHHHREIRQVVAPGLEEVGCYSSSGDLSYHGVELYQDSSTCGNSCATLGKPVMALSNGDECWCGDLLPAEDTSAPSKCTSGCNGYSGTCGGPDAWDVWLTGLKSNVQHVLGGSGGSHKLDHSSAVLTSSIMPSSTLSTSTQETTSTPLHTHKRKPASTSSSVATSHKVIHHKSVTSVPTTKTVNHKAYTTHVVKTVISKQTIVQSPSETPTPNPDILSGHNKHNHKHNHNHNHKHHTQSESAGVNTTVIAVGVVVGVLALICLITGGLLLAKWRRKAKNAENGHRRADSLNAFVAGGATPNFPQGIWAANRMTTVDDSRLDPGIMQEAKRTSSGSVFADNHDYSRRVLTVANPDKAG